MKILYITTILGILILVIFIVGMNLNDQKEDIFMEESEATPKFFQGPVPENCNEEYFRHTGITRRSDIE